MALVSATMTEDSLRRLFEVRPIVSPEREARNRQIDEQWNADYPGGLGRMLDGYLPAPEMGIDHPGYNGHFGDRPKFPTSPTPEEIAVLNHLARLEAVIFQAMTIQ
jgi:hypothetical protein